MVNSINGAIPLPVLTGPDGKPLTVAQQIQNDSLEPFVSLGAYLAAIGDARNKLQNGLNTINALDPLIQKEIYRYLADGAKALFQIRQDLNDQVRIETAFYNLQNGPPSISSLISTFNSNTTGLDTTISNLNTAINNYNADPSNSNLQALKTAINNYNANPAIQALATYSGLITGYNNSASTINSVLSEFNANRAAAGKPLITAAELQFLTLPSPALPTNIPMSPLPTTPLPYEPPSVSSLPTITPFPTPISQSDVTTATTVYINTLVNVQVQLLSNVQFQEGIQTNNNTPPTNDITLPSAYIKTLPGTFFDTTQGISPGTGVVSLLISTGLLSQFLQRLLSQNAYETVLYNAKVPESPGLIQKLQIFTLALVTQSAINAAASRSLQEVTEGSGVPEQPDSYFDITSSLSFSTTVRDLIASGFVQENVGRLVASDPELASLTATQKQDLVASLSAVLNISLAIVALSQISLSLGTPGLIPQLLANIPAFSFSANGVPSGSLAAVLVNPLAQLFLKANLVAILAQQQALPAGANLTGSETQQVKKVGSHLDRLTTIVQMINQAVNNVISKEDQLTSEEDLRSAFRTAFSQQGFTGTTLTTLTESAVSLIKSENALPSLDTTFSPNILAAVAPLLTTTPAPIPAPTLPTTPTLATTLSSILLSDPSQKRNKNQVEALVSRVINSVLAQGAYTSPKTLSEAIALAFTKRGISESLANSLGQAAASFITSNSKGVTTPFAASALSALIPQLPINISPFAIPNIPLGAATVGSGQVQPTATIADALVNFLLSRTDFKGSRAQATQIVNNALNSLLASGAIRTPEELSQNLTASFEAQGLSNSTASDLANATVGVINERLSRQPPNTAFATTFLNAVFPQLISNVTASATPRTTPPHVASSVTPETAEPPAANVPSGTSTPAPNTHVLKAVSTHGRTGTIAAGAASVPSGTSAPAPNTNVLKAVSTPHGRTGTIAAGAASVPSGTSTPAPNTHVLRAAPTPAIPVSPLVNLLASQLSNEPNLGFSQNSAADLVNRALNTILGLQSFSTPEALFSSAKAAFRALGIPTAVAKNLAQATVNFVTPGTTDATFAASAISAFTPQLVQGVSAPVIAQPKTEGGPIPTQKAAKATAVPGVQHPLSHLLTEILHQESSQGISRNQAETIVNGVLNQVISQGAFKNANELSTALSNAFQSQGITQAISDKLATKAVAFINSAGTNPTFTTTALSTLLPQIIKNVSVTNHVIAPTQTIPANAPPEVFPQNPARTQLVQNLSGIVVKNTNINREQAENLVNQAINHVLSTPGVLNNVASALNGFVREFRALGLPEQIANRLANEAIKTIKNTTPLSHLGNSFAPEALHSLVTTRSELAVASTPAVPSTSSGASAAHAAATVHAVASTPEVPSDSVVGASHAVSTVHPAAPKAVLPSGELPPFLNKTFPVGTPGRDLLLKLINEAQTRKEIGVALNNVLKNISSNINSIESFRAFHSQLYLELIAQHIPAHEAIRLAGQATQIATPEPSEHARSALLSPSPEIALSPPALAEDLTNTAIALLTPRLDIFKAGDVAGQIIRSVVGTNSLRSVLNEQARILKEDDNEEALRAITKNTANLSTPNLNVPRLAMKSNISEVIANRREAMISSVPETDIRTRDTSKEPITFDKNISLG